MNFTEPRPVLPRPERDPYFNRTAGADQVPPPVAGSASATLAPEDEPEIVRDYRLRRAMIPLERAFKLTGRVGFAVAVCSAVVLIAWSGTSMSDHGFTFGIQPGEEPARIARFGIQLIWIVLATIFAWGCRRLVRGDRQARLIFTIEAAAAIAGCLAREENNEALIVVFPSVLLTLLLLWRPRGRRYFTSAYPALVDRTPGVTFSRDAGRVLATMLLTSLLVIQFANGYWIHRMLHSA